MENQHLTYFKVENFKKFDSLEVKDIGQFNLIVGDNNVGKTCLLEAFLVDKNIERFSTNLFKILIKRKLFSAEEFDKLINQINYRNYKLLSDKYSTLLKKRLKKDIDKEAITFYVNNDVIDIFDSSNEWGSSFEKNRKEIEFNSLISTFTKIDDPYFNFPFIAFNSVFEKDIYDLYNNLKTKKEKENLITTIKVVDANIIDVELRQNFDDLDSVFLLSFKNREEFVPLNYLGDGFKRIFYIILKVLSLGGKRIMIDEIETGIHHSRQKDFLISIIKVCKELNVQLFATTHSEECIKAFYEASKELELEEKIRLISLEEGKKDKIYATTNRFENIEAGLISNIEFRK